MGDQTPVEYAALPQKLFPFTIDYVAMDNGQTVQSQLIDGPGAFEVLMGLAAEHGPIKIVISYADGTVLEQLPDSEGEAQVCL